ncbi:MAG: hypothetical protein JW882_10675 [Deltaproteobacteria bacterium]|nr:hypothetical protein [Deltaproteobacteria bacterium]
MRIYFRLIAACGVLVFLIFSGPAVCSAQPIGIGATQEESKTYNRVLSSEYGRYVFGQVSDSSKDLFMLDTETGRLWRVAESGKVGIFLKTVPYRIESIEGDEYSPFPVTESGHDQKTSEN